MPSESISTPAELVAAREARGISAEDMQRQLKIHIKQLDALERGEWDSLPEMSFVRAMLRSYGRAIDVNVEPLLATIGGHGIATDLKSSASLQEPIRPTGMLGFGNGGSGNSWSWLALMAAGVAALALFFGKAGDSSRVPSWLGGPSATTGSATQSAADTPATPAVGREAAAPEKPETGHKLELVVRRESAGLDRLVVTLTPDNASAPAGAISLKVSSAENSWVRLSQADGLVMLLGAYRAGSTDEFNTRGVVTLVTDYPASVKLEFDGKPVSLELPAGTRSMKARLP